ncbi:NAD(P)/FAD-dependent oxidoreductase [Bhargavaea beijingensis]|uniref:D-amino-acid dehydrogenase n=1 Tax=Bhargavaea beijingensis TaxID=426756 RepID=A0A1G7FI13_9BACL|nr:FAD-dependent oxidoreductase [Bhargavaea beijingensis]MCW1929378.1 FAD-binding oxidoreductase [Bhargavaea beijingensis]RSK31009.1 FAD-dependent oxidoreductase [Bhargavaea beijingensis]SDE75543.1 D-amino-acid dehydrogenase [Bhargavaea beijingensis]
MNQVIIIGGGILGASAAYQLAKSGYAVTVIDRGEPGQATGAAAGIICPWLSQRRNKAWYALAKGGAAFYPELIRSLEQDGETETGYRRVGAVSVHTDPAVLDLAEERAVTRRVGAPEIGEIRRLSEEETREIVPMLGEEFASVRISGAARVNGGQLRKAMLSAAQKHGAAIVHGSAVVSAADGKVNGAMVDGELIRADAVLVTAGAWAAEAVAPIGLKLDVHAQKAQILHLRLENEPTDDWPVIMPPRRHYIVPADNGKIIVGTTHEDEHEFEMFPTAGAIHEMLDKAFVTAPLLKKAVFEEVNVGYRPFTADNLPVAGRLGGIDGLYFANGLGSSGLTVGPYLGVQLAKMATGETLDIDPALYSPDKAIARE